MSKGKGTMPGADSRRTVTEGQRLKIKGPMRKVKGRRGKVKDKRLKVEGCMQMQVNGWRVRGWM